MPDPRRCGKYTDPLLQETPHADRPRQKTMPSWVNFGLAQTGQLVIANDDKRKARHVQKVCEDETAIGFEKARRKMLPWYRKIFLSSPAETVAEKHKAPGEAAEKP